MPVPKGTRIGGRQKGTRNKSTEERVKLAQVAANSGETPLEYMLRVMRTSEDEKRRDSMAVAAAPFVHPRLANVEANIEHSGGVVIETGVPTTKARTNGHAHPH